MPNHVRQRLEQGRHVPGVFQLNPDMSVGDTIDELLLIARTSQLEEYRDYLLYLPLR
jgi:hypothetical protein